tara:strand:+ start:540 stop:2195 length:1656 start_codon:yes stop_codon:yes gene_type:complete
MDNWKSKYLQMKLKYINAKVGGTISTNVNNNNDICVVTLNIEYFRSWYQQYKNDDQNEKLNIIPNLNKLKQDLDNCDILCVQEDSLKDNPLKLKTEQDTLGLRNYFNQINFWEYIGFNRIISSMDQDDKTGFTIREQIYEHPPTVDTLRDRDNMSYHFDYILGNSIYINQNSSWKFVPQSHKFTRINSDEITTNYGPLCGRCVVSAKFQKNNETVKILNTHFTGGRFEDESMKNDDMASERGLQLKKCLDEFEDGIKNILVGDFNATAYYEGPMEGYYNMLRENNDNLKGYEDLKKEVFKKYIMSPFIQLSNNTKGKIIYTKLDGPTSQFGQIVDYFITSHNINISNLNRIRLVNKYHPAAEKWDTDDPLKNDAPNTMMADHNAVKITFDLNENKKYTDNYKLINNQKKINQQDIKNLNEIIEKADKEIIYYPKLKYDDSFTIEMDIQAALKEKAKALINSINTWFQQESNDQMYNLIIKFIKDSVELETTKLDFDLDKNWCTTRTVGNDNDTTIFNINTTESHLQTHSKLLSHTLLQYFVDNNFLQVIRN